MLGVERMTVASAVSSPKMVVMDLRSRCLIPQGLCWEHLAIDCSVLCLQLRRLLIRLKLGWNIRAVVLINHELGDELHEQRLLQGVAHAVMIGIDVKLSSRDRLLRGQHSGEQVKEGNRQKRREKEPISAKANKCSTCRHRCHPDRPPFSSNSTVNIGVTGTENSANRVSEKPVSSTPRHRVGL